MTLLSPSSDTPHPVRRRCVGGASDQPSQGMRESGASVGPHPYGTDAPSEPSAGASATSASGASDTSTDTRTCRVCGCTDWAACLNAFNQPCYWIEPDLCSECRPHAEACS